MTKKITKADLITLMISDYSNQRKNDKSGVAYAIRAIDPHNMKAFYYEDSKRADLVQTLVSLLNTDKGFNVVKEFTEYREYVVEDVKLFIYEIYTTDPVTGDGGHDIKFIAVFSEDSVRAAKILKEVPNFDCIILKDRYDVPLSAEDWEVYNAGNMWAEMDNDYVYINR